MARPNARYFWILVVATLGCQSPYHADRGALFGGLAGAGVGALVGDALGDTGAGAAIGAGVGALTGAVVGSNLDEIEARNRAEMAAQLGREIEAGSVSPNDVIALSNAGVSDSLIVTHIEHNGVAAPTTPSDLILLKNSRVSDLVIQAMQQAPLRSDLIAPKAASLPPPPTTTIIEEHHYGPVFGPPFSCEHHHFSRRGDRHGARTHWGISISH